MKKILLSYIASGFLISGFASESNDLEIENRILKDRLHSLENVSTKKM